jgi:TonB family protein
VVNQNGTISDVEVVKGSGYPAIDAEAIRVVKSMPLWKPAKMDGKTVRCYFNLPFTMAISSPYYVFNTSNTNGTYIQAWQAILADNPSKALELYSEIPDDVEAMYNMAVIYYNKRKKSEAKKYFEEVKNTVTDTKSQYYILSSRFLANNF